MCAPIYLLNFCVKMELALGVCDAEKDTIAVESGNGYSPREFATELRLHTA